MSKVKVTATFSKPIVKVVGAAAAVAALFLEYKVIQHGIIKIEPYFNEILEKFYKGGKVDIKGKTKETTEGDATVLTTGAKKIYNQEGDLIGEETVVGFKKGGGSDGTPHNSADVLAALLTGVTAGYTLANKGDLVEKVELAGVNVVTDESTLKE